MAATSFNNFYVTFLISIYGVIFCRRIVGIPIGIMISRKRSLANWIIRLANIIQTVPALAMLSILMLGMGLGVNTVVVTVFLYSLLPIIKNTYTGMIQVDRNILDVGKGMGMTKVQLLYMVELPLSVSVIMAGIRNALVVAIGITAIGAFRWCWWFRGYYYSWNQCHRWCFYHFSRCLTNGLYGDYHRLGSRDY